MGEAHPGQDAHSLGTQATALISLGPGRSGGPLQPFLGGSSKGQGEAPRLPKHTETQQSPRQEFGQEVHVLNKSAF